MVCQQLISVGIQVDPLSRYPHSEPFEYFEPTCPNCGLATGCGHRDIVQAWFGATINAHGGAQLSRAHVAGGAYGQAGGRSATPLKFCSGSLSEAGTKNMDIERGVTTRAERRGASHCQRAT